MGVSQNSNGATSWEKSVCLSRVEKTPDDTIFKMTNPYYYPVLFFIFSFYQNMPLFALWFYPFLHARNERPEKSRIFENSKTKYFFNFFHSWFFTLRKVTGDFCVFPKNAKTAKTAILGVFRVFTGCSRGVKLVCNSCESACESVWKHVAQPELFNFFRGWSELFMTGLPLVCLGHLLEPSLTTWNLLKSFVHPRATFVHTSHACFAHPVFSIFSILKISQILKIT